MLRIIGIALMALLAQDGKPVVPDTSAIAKQYLEANFEERDLDRNTLILFTSDNGPETALVSSFGSPGVLRGAKGFVSNSPSERSCNCSIFRSALVNIDRHCLINPMPSSYLAIDSFIVRRSQGGVRSTSLPA